MFEKFRSFNTYTHDFLVQGFTILLSLSFSFHILRPSTEQNFPRESERASGIKVSEKRELVGRFNKSRALECLCH